MAHRSLNLHPVVVLMGWSVGASGLDRKSCGDSVASRLVKMVGCFCWWLWVAMDVGPVGATLNILGGDVS